MALWLSQVTFFTFVLIHMNDAGVLESCNRLTSCSVSVSPPTLKISGGIPSGPGASIASLQLLDSLDGLCF